MKYQFMECGRPSSMKESHWLRGKQFLNAPTS